MKKEYFRIVLTSQGDQVLISKDYDAEKEKSVVKITAGATDTEGLIIQGTISMVFEDEEARDIAFTKINTEDADLFYQIIDDQIKEVLKS